jgi:hypothetical protein
MIPRGVIHPERDEFTVDLKCHRCGQTGVSTWEENTGVNRNGRQTSLVSVSSGFYERLSKKSPHSIELVCHNCEAVQLG